MNFHLHKHRKLSEVVKVPDGLRELMADITREVLRFQPDNIEKFIADYLEAMLLTRELHHIASLTIEDVLDSSCQIVEYLRKGGVSVEQAESAVEVMKEEFKGHLADMGEDEPLKELNIVNRLVSECKLTADQAQSASEIIESAWSHYYRRNKQQITKINPEFTQHDAVKNTLLLYQKTKASCVELNEKAKLLEPGFKEYLARKAREEKKIDLEDEAAAVKIQAWFRGAKVKRDYREKVKAATTIQAGFRGYKTRKELKEIHNDEVITSTKTAKTPDEAATVIQAHFRGYNHRKNLHKTN